MIYEVIGRWAERASGDASAPFTQAFRNLSMSKRIVNDDF